MPSKPVLALWDGEDCTFTVAPRDRAVARKMYGDGQVQHHIEVREERSSKQHSFYMASVDNAWQNLRGEAAQIFNTPRKLRQWALIRTNWYTQTVTDIGTRELALRLVVFMPKFASEDEYVELEVRNTSIIVKRAMSQSLMMKNDDFKASSRDVLELLANEINVTRRDLERSWRNTA